MPAAYLGSSCKAQNVVIWTHVVLLACRMCGCVQAEGDMWHGLAAWSHAKMLYVEHVHHSTQHSTCVLAHGTLCHTGTPHMVHAMRMSPMCLACK